MLSSVNPIHDVRLVTTSSVKCDGNEEGGLAGHPLVYLNMGEKDSVVCPYCSRQFIVTEPSQKITES